jgi:hypothetical protein
MKLLPVQSSTFVVAYPADEVKSRLCAVVKSVDESVFRSSGREENYMFNGIIQSDKFIISRKLNHYQNFIPRIRGRIESTSRGSIVFVKYSLFFGSLLIWLLISSIALTIGLVFLLMQQNITFFLLALAGIVINYVMILSNFNRQVKISQMDLEYLLNVDSIEKN